MQKAPVYLDHNATTPLNEKVLQAMLPYFSDKFGNASSKTHAYGWIAADGVENARIQVADFIGASPDEIIFTSGATEAANMALKGVFEKYKPKGNQVITVQTEHKAVLDSTKYLESVGAEVIYLRVSRDGLLDPEDLEKAITSKTILIAVMAANNETGVLQPIETVGKIAHDKGILFFCDATQAAGKSRLAVNEIQADLLCLSAHKINGPKGVGALYARRRNPKVNMVPLMHGGGHEHGRRSGTLNVPGIVGMGEACSLASGTWWDFASEVSTMRTYFEQHLIDLGDIRVNGSVKFRLPNTSNLLIKGVHHSDLIGSLPDVAFATGSACTSESPEPSHVLLSMGLSEEEANCSARFSLGKGNTRDEINYVMERIKEVVLNVRKRH